jgi:SET domain-containing protein
MKNYRPLPDCLTVKSSKIEGLGLFATTDIEKNTVLGISHILYQKEYIRTPLGGFVNHSEDSNLKKLLIDDKFYLLTKNSIKAGDELTLTYTLYNVTYSS